MTHAYYEQRLAGLTDDQLRTEYARRLRDALYRRSPREQTQALAALDGVRAECTRRGRPALMAEAVALVQGERS